MSTRIPPGHVGLGVGEVGGQGVHCLSDDDQAVEDGIECHLGRVRVVVVFRAEELLLGPLGPCDCFQNVGQRFSLPSRSDGHKGTASATARLESPIISPRFRVVAARCFDQWEALIATRLRADGWSEDSLATAASAALALIEGALLLARVSGQLSHLAHAKHAALTLLGAPPAQDNS
jgi:hypothetical protein